jgi:hypothetical protein
MRQNVIVILVSTGLAALAGCATDRQDLIANGQLSIETEPKQRGHYRDIHARAGDGQLRITGYVRRSLNPGSLTVQVLSPQHEVITEERVNVHRPLRSSRVRHTRFEVAIPLIPERGSVVRLIHRPGTGE